MRVNRVGSEESHDFYGMSFSASPEGEMIGGPTGRADGIMLADVGSWYSWPRYGGNGRSSGKGGRPFTPRYVRNNETRTGLPGALCKAATRLPPEKRTLQELFRLRERTKEGENP